MLDIIGCVSGCCNQNHRPKHGHAERKRRQRGRQSADDKIHGPRDITIGLSDVSTLHRPPTKARPARASLPRGQTARTSQSQSRHATRSLSGESMNGETFKTPSRLRTLPFAVRTDRSSISFINLLSGLFPQSTLNKICDRSTTQLPLREVAQWTVVKLLDSSVRLCCLNRHLTLEIYSGRHSGTEDSLLVAE